MNIIDLIYLQNPWFRDAGYQPPEFNLPKRNPFNAFFDEIINTKQVISLTGLRRVGKSTLIKQAISELFRKNIEKRQILYFSFDQPTVKEDTQTLENLLETYFLKILGKETHKINKSVYIFLDEIQLVPFWQDIIKRYYDLNQNLKFVVSGSSSLFIAEKAKESLAGRLFERYLGPLTFSEYQKLSGRNDLVEFLDFGQFPELLSLQNKERKIEYLREGIIGKVLEIDIPKTYGIRKIYDFERLFWSLLPNAGQIIQSSKLASDLQIKKATLFKYLNILEKSLLINKALNFAGSFRSEKRLLRKLYPASANFLSVSPDLINIGFKAEAYVCSLLKQTRKPVYLYHQRGKEIDFLLPDEKIALEVKFQEHIFKSDYDFAESFVIKKGYEGILLTKNEDKLLSKNIRAVSFEKWEKEIEKFS